MNAVLKAVPTRPLMFSATMAALTELSAVGLIATSAFLITRAAQQPSIAALAVAIAAVRGFAMARGAFRYVERLASHDSALRAVARLRTKVYRALVRDHRSTRDGDTLSRLVSDSESIQDLIVRVVLPAATALITSAAAVTLTLVLRPAAGLMLLAGLLIAGLVVPALTAAAAARSGARLADARARLSVSSLDLVEGARDLAAFGATAQALRRADDDAATLATLERRTAIATSAATAGGLLTQGITTLLVALTAIRSSADSVLVAVLALTTLAAVETVLPLTEAAAQLTALRPALRRVQAILTAATAPVRPLAESPNDDIDLTNVTVRFDRVALEGVDLHIPAGQSVAIVGASGAGKSTLLETIAGLVAADHGAVTAPPSRTLTQDAHLFHTTARANMILARPDAGDRELDRAARQAGIADWITTLAAGWGTSVGERSSQLSGGQRQRLLLTRTLLADPDALLLDEPTEALDADQANAVLGAILETRRGRTTVVVTHRLTPMPMFDQIVVLDCGRIIDRGTHDELLTRTGVYRDLWAAELFTSAGLRSVTTVATATG